MGRASPTLKSRFESHQRGCVRSGYRKEAEYRVGERRYGAFSRSIHLAASVDAEKLAASMDNGVLKIIAPKNGKSQSKTIQVQAAK